MPILPNTHTRNRHRSISIRIGRSSARNAAINTPVYFSQLGAVVY